MWGCRVCVLALRHTKTGDDLSAEVRVPWLWGFLERWVGRRRLAAGRGAVLFPGGAPLFRRALADSCRRLGLGEAGLVMHSFRGGGALHLLHSEVGIEEVLRRGRWRRPESARPYLQRLRALAVHDRVPRAVLERGARYALAPRLTLEAFGL